MTIRPNLYPLNEFYAMAEMPLPAYELVSDAQVPQPQRQLLVHNNDMTPTLENFYQEEITLHIQRLVRRENYLLREVTLKCHNKKPVVFGAIRINLYLYPAPVVTEILACVTPLGAILREHRIPHKSSPQAFFKIHSDAIINDALAIDGAHMLYGRVNKLLDRYGQPLVEVVEILPPA